MRATDTLIKLISIIFQVLLVASTWMILDISNYSNLNNLIHEYLGDTGGE